MKNKKQALIYLSVTGIGLSGIIPMLPAPAYAASVQTNTSIATAEKMVATAQKIHSPKYTIHTLNTISTLAPSDARTRLYQKIWAEIDFEKTNYASALVSNSSPAYNQTDIHSAVKEVKDQSKRSSLERKLHEVELDTKTNESYQLMNLYQKSFLTPSTQNVITDRINKIPDSKVRDSARGKWVTIQESQSNNEVHYFIYLARVTQNADYLGIAQRINQKIHQNQNREANLLYMASERKKNQYHSLSQVKELSDALQYLPKAPVAARYDFVRYTDSLRFTPKTSLERSLLEKQKRAHDEIFSNNLNTIFNEIRNNASLRNFDDLTILKNEVSFASRELPSKDVANFQASIDSFNDDLAISQFKFGLKNSFLQNQSSRENIRLMNDAISRVKNDRLRDNLQKKIRETIQENALREDARLFSAASLSGLTSDKAYANDQINRDRQLPR